MYNDSYSPTSEYSIKKAKDIQIIQYEPDLISNSKYPSRNYTSPKDFRPHIL